MRPGWPTTRIKTMPRPRKPQYTERTKTNLPVGAAGRKATTRTGALDEKKRSVKSVKTKGTTRKHAKARPEKYHQEKTRM